MPSNESLGIEQNVSRAKQERQQQNKAPIKSRRMDGFRMTILSKGKRSPRSYRVWEEKHPSPIRFLWTFGFFGISFETSFFDGRNRSVTHKLKFTTHLFYTAITQRSSNRWSWDDASFSFLARKTFRVHKRGSRHRCDSSSFSYGVSLENSAPTQGRVCCCCCCCCTRTNMYAQMTIFLAPIDCCDTAHIHHTLWRNHIVKTRH